MGAETIGLLVVVGVIVAVLALYLITIGLALTRLNRTLGSIVAGLTLIRDRTVPVGGVLGDIVAEVDALEQNLDVLLGAVGGAPAVASVVSMGDAVANARGGRAAQAPASSRAAPADMGEAVARARRAAPARNGDAEDTAVDEPAADEPPPSPATRTNVMATTRTPRPRGAPPRQRPARTSKRSRVRVLEESSSTSRDSGRRAGKRKQLALTAGLESK